MALNENENLPSATANDGSKRGGDNDPAVAATRNRKPSYTMQQKKAEEIEQIEKLAETVGEKVDEMLVDIRVDNESHLNEDQIIVQDEAERMVKATNKVEKMYESMKNIKWITQFEERYLYRLCNLCGVRIK